MQESRVHSEQRFTQDHPCPICGGHAALPHGRGVRCYGFRSADQEWAHCTREEHAGEAPLNEKSGAFVHKLTGNCKCGTSHNTAPVIKLHTPREGSRNGHSKAAPKKPRGMLTNTYEIRNASDELVALHDRYEAGDDKYFRWRGPDGQQGLNGFPLADMPLYGSENIKGWPQDKPVLIVEGEKPKEAAEAAGFRVLATVTGANSTPGAKALEVLLGRKVLFWPDTDPEGLKHMDAVAEKLQGIASEIRVYTWHDAPVVLKEDGKPKGQDAADHPAIISGDQDAIWQLAEELGRAPKWQPSRAEGVPKIQVNNRHLRDVTAEALEALRIANDPPEVFVRAGALARVREDEHGTPQIQAMEMHHVRGRLARVADFVRVTENGETKVNPPEVVVKDLMALSSWPLPALESVVESPILRPDGSVVDRPGYDPETRLYLWPVPGFEYPVIPKDPSSEEVRAALDLVGEVLADFPFADESSAANTLALLLTSVVRAAVDGPVPLALIDKPSPGSGGSLLAESVALIGTGRSAEMLGAPRDDEEWRKMITSKLVTGSSMVTIDNVEGALFAPSLSRALTARIWTDRVLGRSEVVTVSQQATWIATGNNIALRGDLPRRCYWVRIDPKQSRPWQREGFRHPDLLAWVAKQRAKLVAALLTIARAWYAAGKPKSKGLPRLGSFEAWTEIVGSMLEHAGIKGFLGNLAELYEKADEGNREWETFLEEWWKQSGEDPVTVKKLAKLIDETPLLKDALPGDLSEALGKGEGSFTRRLGKALSKRAGTRFGDDGLHVVEVGEERRAKLWSVRDSSGECEFVSFVSLYNPSASNFSGEESEGVRGSTGKTAQEEPETNSLNSQTHTDDDPRAKEYQRLVRQGYKRKLAWKDVYGVEPREGQI